MIGGALYHAAMGRTWITSGLALVMAFAASAQAGDLENPPIPKLPPPGAAVFRMPKLVPWPAGGAPVVPAGFRVERFAAGLDGPRSLCVLPDGAVLVAQARTERLAGLPPAVVEALTRQGVFGPSANTIVMLRSRPGGSERHEFLSGLRQPYGMLVLGDWFYVANTDSLLRFRYRPGAARPEGAAEKIADLPAREPNNHWTRNIAAAPDGRTIFLAVGSGTNINEGGTDGADRAAIWAMRPDGRERRLYATGLRNPVGLEHDPATGQLWATVNERDGLGEDVPPDYLTRVLEGAFYGWPWVYFGGYADPTHARLDPRGVEQAKQRARVPDLALGAHTVPLGLHFYRGSMFPGRYRAGVFVARRGGGGRARFEGFDVVFVPFRDGQPSGSIEPFLGGFVASLDRGEVYGRPVDVAELPDGSLLVSDDGGDLIWRISYAGGV
jgi:glucose/arabinose dehydrogenase